MAWLQVVNVRTQPNGYVSDNTDCDDTSNTTYPNVESCNGIDDDCNNNTDSYATDAITWYEDFDSTPSKPELH